MDLRERFATGKTFEQFLESGKSLRELWQALARRASVAPEIVDRVRALGDHWHLLVLNADWCGDSVNTMPYIAKLAEDAPNVEMRLLDRDENLDLMDSHLTGTSRSIPKVIVVDGDFAECGTWGPRPGEIQRWVIEHGLALPKADRYKEVRTWYARDGGRTTLEEIVSLLERCALPEGGHLAKTGF